MMIKKIFLISFLLTPCFSLLSSAEHFYAFTMHATHAEQYDKDAWKESITLMDALDKQCEATDADENFDSFMVSINLAKTTTQKILELYQNKTGLNVRVGALLKHVETPKDGLFISISSAMEKTLAEDYILIERMIKDKQSGKTEDHEQNALAILDAIQPVLDLSAGDIFIRLNIVE